MTSFSKVRQTLIQARTERAGAEDRAAAARHAVGRIEARQREATRTAEPRRTEILRKLEEQAKQAQIKLDGQLQELKGLSAHELAALAKFAKLADPREGIGQLDDRFPTRHSLWHVKMAALADLPPSGNAPLLARLLFV